MLKKYLIRIVGAVCILGALALMFMPSWFEMEDIDRSALRDLRSDVSGVCSTATDAFVYQLESDDDFKEELQDYDLPHSKSKVKSWFRDTEKLINKLFDDTISLQELLNLSLKAPGLIQDAENLLESNCSDVFFFSAAQYVLYEGSEAIDEEWDYETIQFNADLLAETMDDNIDTIVDVSPAFTLLAGMLILILALGVIAAITHVCNKGRWLKYLVLVITLVLVVGSCVVVPIISDTLADISGEIPALEDMTLKMTVTPFIAVALMIVPVVLDIVFERKKEKILAEE